jgi:hypothetical protein
MEVSVQLNAPAALPPPPHMIHFNAILRFTPKPAGSTPHLPNITHRIHTKSNLYFFDVSGSEYPVV